ncbi:MBL fold metallo-hydrolase [Vibrio sp. 1S139]|uniref:MBL fold metallo-hydrolase n=1 Tax=Vibrio sp. 1S139 TaxID=3230006 RepID=UPI00352FBCBE
MISISPISGLGEKGPACFLLRIKNTNILLDCGRGPDNNKTPTVSKLPKVIDAVVFSHLHNDHIGAQELIKNHTIKEVWATKLTWKKLVHTNFAGSKCKVLPANGHCLIAELDVQTGRTGHVAGGVWVHFKDEGGLTYLSDIQPESITYAFDPPPPSKTMIMDASYKTWDVPLSDSVESFKKELQPRTLFPVSPYGRAAEMALIAYRQEKKISVCSKVYSALIDLLNNSEYLKTECIAEIEQLLQYVVVVYDVADYTRTCDLPIFATSAQLTDGFSDRLLHFYGERLSVALTGHIAQGSQAQKEFEKGSATFIRWPVHPTFSQQIELLVNTKPRHTILAFAEDVDVSPYEKKYSCDYYTDGSKAILID